MCMSRLYVWVVYVCESFMETCVTWHAWVVCKSFMYESFICVSRLYMSLLWKCVWHDMCESYVSRLCMSRLYVWVVYMCESFICMSRLYVRVVYMCELFISVSCLYVSVVYMYESFIYVSRLYMWVVYMCESFICVSRLCVWAVYMCASFICVNRLWKRVWHDMFYTWHGKYSHVWHEHVLNYCRECGTRLECSPCGVASMSCVSAALYSSSIDTFAAPCVTHVNVSCYTCERVMSHMCGWHVTHVNIYHVKW